MSRLAIYLLVLGVVVQTSDADGQAQTAPRTAAIYGQVIARKTGDPIAGAKISPFKLDSTNREMPQAVSDSGGGFAIEGLAAGDYGLTVRIDGEIGWVDADAGLRPGASLEVPPGTVELLFRRVNVGPRRTSTVRIELVRMPTVSGRVTDDTGAAVSSASVCALRQHAIAGRREWVSSDCGQTDSNGRYSFAAYPGTVTLSAAVPKSFARERAQAGAPYTLLRTFHPDATDISRATVSRLEWDEDQSDVNLTMARVETVRVSGTIVGAAAAVDRPYGHLLYVDPLLRRLDSFASASDFDGMRFQFDGVPPGEYLIESPDGHLEDPASGQPVQARHPVNVVRGDVVKLDVQVEPAVRLSGRMMFDGRAALPEAASDLGPTRVLLGLPEQSAIGHIMPATTMVGPDGAFSSVPVPAGAYLVSVLAPPNGWRLRSAIVNGRDAADVPIDLFGDFSNAVVTMTHKPAGVTGRVASRTADAAPYAIVLVFPANRARWVDFGLGRRFRSRVTGSDGAFRFDDLPSGDYFVAAVTRVPSSGWRDEVWLGSLVSLSTRVSVAEGVVQTVSLTLRTAPAGS